jgi:phosphoenolpyruvate carboxylase
MSEILRQEVNHLVTHLEEQFAQLQEVLEALWQTEEIRDRRVQPLQEVENTLYFFDHTIFEATANFYAAFDAELHAQYPTVKRQQPFLTFGSWVGGDRDGNPMVTPEVSLTALDRHHRVACQFYSRELLRLVEEITHAAPGATRFKQEPQPDGFDPGARSSLKSTMG